MDQVGAVSQGTRSRRREQAAVSRPPRVRGLPRAARAAQRRLDAACGRRVGARSVMDTAVEERPSLAARVARSPGDLLEQIAREYGVSTLEVVRNLSPEQGTVVPGEAFADIMQDLTSWGDVLFLIHNADIVLECTGSIPPGSFSHGYFNIHGAS